MVEQRPFLKLLKAFTILQTIFEQRSWHCVFHISSNIKAITGSQIYYWAQCLVTKRIKRKSKEAKPKVTMLFNLGNLIADDRKLVLQGGDGVKGAVCQKKLYNDNSNKKTEENNSLDGVGLRTSHGGATWLHKWKNVFQGTVYESNHKNQNN